MEQTTAHILQRTREWVGQVVIGLQLCPFAARPYKQELIRYQLSTARDNDQLILDLSAELQLLLDSSPEEIETTVLVHPYMLTDFFDYNDFLALADDVLCDANLEGVFQIASFHPQYQFAGSEPDDISNYSNRSPYPMLHLLREESVSQAVASHPDIETVPEQNIARLQDLGHQGFRAHWNPEG